MGGKSNLITRGVKGNVVTKRAGEGGRRRLRKRGGGSLRTGRLKTKKKK